MVFIVLARYLAADDFGLLGMAAVFIALVQALVDQGMSDALVQRESLRDEHRDTAFWTAVGSGVLLTGAGVLLSRPLAAFFDEPGLPPVVAALSLVVLIGSLGATQAALLRRALAFRPLAVRTLVGTVLGGGVGIAMAVAGYGVWALVGQQVAGTASGTLLLWTASDWRPRLAFSRVGFGELFSFGSRVVGSNLIDFLNRHADDVFIGAYLGATSLGFYTVAYRLLRTATNMLTGFSSAVAFPAFSRMQDQPERLRDNLYTATYITALFSVPTFIGAAMLAPELIEAVFGAQWLTAAPVMRILAFIGILHSVSYFTGSAFYARGHADVVFGLNVLNGVTNVIAFWIAVRWGIVAVAAVYVLRGYLVAPVRLLLLRRHLGVDIRRYLSKLASPAAAAAVMAGAVAGLLALIAPGAGAWPRLAIGVPAGMLVYAGTLWTVDADGIRTVIRIARNAISDPAPGQ